MPHLYELSVDPPDPDEMLVAASKNPRTVHIDGGASILQREGDVRVEDVEGFPSERAGSCRCWSPIRSNNNAGLHCPIAVFS
ncbi:hypothetical protein [Paraburkholderia fungorum]|uniref:hypothetical protein n=1 Tax=Paraburkholderia fungorum TaxID=134537 RepID=UPI0038BB7119